MVPQEIRTAADRALALLTCVEAEKAALEVEQKIKLEEMEQILEAEENARRAQFEVTV